VKNQLRSMIKPAVVLFIICLIVSSALAFTYAITKDTMDERAAKDAENARKEVLAEATGFKPVENMEEIVSKSQELQIIKEAYEGISGDATIGYVFLVENKGYGGNMKITVGINNEGEITGVRIGDNNETPGLGSKASDKSFISQFVNFIPQEPLKVIKAEKTKREEIQAISGATVSSKAVTSAVQAAVDMASELIKEGGKAK
jgi:electron transport complex protein RnfG